MTFRVVKVLGLLIALATAMLTIAAEASAKKDKINK